MDRKKSHTKDELVDLYAQMKYPMEYFIKFESNYQKCYSELFSDMKDFEDDDFNDKDETIGGIALQFATRYVNKFMAQLDKGHSEEWAHLVAESIEDNNSLIIANAYNSMNPELAKQELRLYCKSLGGDEFFEKHYLFLFEIGESWNNPLETAMEYSRIYKQQIAKGKSETFAHHYADLMSGNEYVEIYCQKYAYAYDKALSEGKSKEYAELFAGMYGDGAANHGEREDRDIPDFWEEKVFGYMKGWEYATNNNLSNDFIGIYENVYLNTVYADEPEKISWDRLEEYILEEALKKYNEMT